jgi:two-component system chemotaxis response regulator CheB
LVVDDTAVYRKIVKDVLSGVEGIEVVDTAVNGRFALEKCERLKPTLMTLDMEMPEMTGLEVLRYLNKTQSPIGAIMLSAFTADGAEATLAALELGAFDFVLKPSGSDFSENMQELSRTLIPKIHAFGRAYGRAQRSQPAPSSNPTPCSPIRPERPSQNAPTQQSALMENATPEVVAIGVSTGGPQALKTLLQKLPADLQVPVLIVQHMPPKFTESLANDLNAHSDIAVKEAADGDEVTPGTVYIAPGGRQMKVKRQGARIVIKITDDPPENSCRPAVDYLFRSVAETYRSDALAVILTGMGNDGTEGCKLLKEHKVPLICQDEETCVVFGMPREPIESGMADFVLPLNRIANRIVTLVNKAVHA